MRAEVDLRGLAVERRPAQAAPRGRARRLAVRYVLPGVVLAGFAGVLAWAARDKLLPAHEVTVVPVIAKRAASQRAGTPLFQAAGWIEPRPTPTVVTALAEGVVEKLLVVEGQRVEKGEPVALLIDADARLELRGAEAQLEIARAAAKHTAGKLIAAQTKLANPVHLEAALAEAEAGLAKVETELANLPFDVRVANSKMQLAMDTLEGKTGARGAISERAIQQAKTECDTIQALLDQLKAREPKLEAEAKALRARRTALAKQLELKIDEAHALAEAEADAASGAAKVREAEVHVDADKLRLDRMTVRAGTAGRVLALVAYPGHRVMGLTAGTLADSSTVVTMYDPEKLQVRADVLLEDVLRVQPGQKVRIETPAAAGPLEGEVLFATSTADIQKNTLQVKVAITSPPSAIKPEMLVRATFLAPERHEKTTASQPLRLFVPKSLVTSGQDGAFVWVADRTAGVSRRRAVKLGGDAEGSLVEVLDGLNLADKLVAGGREGLRDGERIAIVAEEQTLGLEQAPASSGKSALPRLAPGKSSSTEHP